MTREPSNEKGKYIKLSLNNSPLMPSDKVIVHLLHLRNVLWERSQRQQTSSCDEHFSAWEYFFYAFFFS